MTDTIHKDYKKKYLKYKSKYFKLKGGLIGVTDDDYNRLTNKPAIFHELYNLNIPFNNNLRDRDNHWNISANPVDDFRLIPKMNPNNTINQTYEKDGEEYFYNHVLINNIFRYAFEQGYTNSGNTDFQILKNTLKSINKIYVLDYQNIVGQMHQYRTRNSRDINTNFQNIRNIMPILTTLQAIINDLLRNLPTIQTVYGNILIRECHDRLISYQTAHTNIDSIINLIQEYAVHDEKQSTIQRHRNKLRDEQSLYDKKQAQYKKKQAEYNDSVTKYKDIKKTGIQADIEQAEAISASIRREMDKLFDERDKHSRIIGQATEYIRHLQREMPETLDDLNRRLVELKTTLVTPPQDIDINNNDMLLSSQQILKTYYHEKISTITNITDNIVLYGRQINDIQTTLNNTNQYIITNLNIDFNIYLITDAINILKNINNYVTYLITDNKLLNRKNIFNPNHQDDTYASGFEVAFTIIRHNIEALNSGNKNLYILCDHRNPNFNMDIENDINDAFKIFYNCFSRSTFRELDISNIVSIQSEFKRPRNNVYAASHGFDDFMFWILGISISSIIHGCFIANPEDFITHIPPDGFRNLNYIINTQNLQNRPPRLILLTNDTQKLNDIIKDGNKNLYSELVQLYSKINLQTGEFQYKIYVNGYENRYLNICLYDLLVELVHHENDINLPDKFSVHGHAKLNRCVITRQDSKLNLGTNVAQTTNINNLINNIKEFLGSDCTEFEKFMVFVKYLQQIYFGAVHDRAEPNEYAMTLNTCERFFTNQNI